VFELNFPRIITLVVVALPLLVAISLQSGCAFDPCNPGHGIHACTGTGPSTAEQGGSGVTIHLPIPEDDMTQCVQGAGGAYSHSGTSTLHDLDLDTSNSVNEEVYAPTGGTAYVHTESATTNFGYHVNIDLGDGSYVVVAHMDEVFVSDGAEVAQGQLLGYEGCTGACSGDHVHIGRHEGDPSLKAEYGESIEVDYYVEDVTAESGFADMSGDAFTCGLTSLGDEENGHWYRSGLPVTRWHPNGTLVKTPDAVQVYRLDDGQARWIQDEDIFWSYGYDFDDVVTIAGEELDCYEAGMDIAQEGLVDAVYDEDGELWLIVAPLARSDRYRMKVQDVAWEALLASWGVSYDAGEPPPSVGSDHEYLTDWPEADGYAVFRDGSLLKEGSSSTVYIISDGYAVPIKDWNTYLMLGFHDRAIITLGDGELEIVQGLVGSCNAGLWCLDLEAITSCGGGLELGEGESGGTEGGGDTGGIEDTGSEGLEEETSECDYDVEERDEDPAPCTDQDGDCYCNEATNGSDCWDSNADVNPGESEICGNGIDEDCSGSDESCGASETDTDGDGVVDADDNCPLHDNTDQSDEDADGLGDSCDTNDSSSSSADTGADSSGSSSGTDTSSDTGGSSSSSSADTEDTGGSAVSTARTLTVGWTTPFSATANAITLSGEYVFADGSYGFTWRDLTSVSSDASIEYVISGVASGDTLRFSVEYEDSAGNVSWSCIAPFPPGTLQGTASADVDGTSVSLSAADDPTSEGCGLSLTVP
jgi:hypothetical protein